MTLLSISYLILYLGDSIDLLAEDYGCTRLQIEEAIRYEIPPQST
ncbi:hypothetical protein [Pseudanabaena sp. SR411]|nr:hypothetical protein [Pseudanabaena sp. SR411]